MTKISDTPATAPAANWYTKGRGASVDMAAEMEGSGVGGAERGEEETGGAATASCWGQVRLHLELTAEDRGLGRGVRVMR